MEVELDVGQRRVEFLPLNESTAITLGVQFQEWGNALASRPQGGDRSEERGSLRVSTLVQKALS
jgi:hypothetical protein